MNAKSSKTTGTGTSTKGTLAKTQAKAAKRTAKIATKHEAIRKAGKPATSGNPLLRAKTEDFAEVLNKATVAQMEQALSIGVLTPKDRGRIQAALANRRNITEAIADGQKAAAENVAKTVEAVAKGDLAKGVEVPMPAKKTGKPKTPKAEGKMSGLDAAAKVLAESPTPLNAKQIVEAMAAQGYWTSDAATPHATIYAAMLREAATKGSASRFAKVDRGLWTLAAAAKKGK